MDICVRLFVAVCVILALSCHSVEAQGCPAPTDDCEALNADVFEPVLRSRLSQSAGEQAANVTITILDFTVVCETVGTRRGRARGASVLVRFDCTADIASACPDNSSTSGLQYDARCLGQDTWNLGTSTFAIGEGVGFGDSTLFCGLCLRQFDPTSPDSHCASATLCADECTVGLQRCTSALDESCCNVYYDDDGDRTNDVCCSECPQGFIADANFDCGCPLLELENGEVTYSDPRDTVAHYINTVATFSCNAGFSIVNDVNRTCRPDTGWDGDNNTACIPEATNCTEAGYTSCCVYMMEGDCTVTTATSRCNCNQECYYFENCCEDVLCSLFQFEFESVEYTVSEGEGSVEVCVLVSPFLATSSRVTIQTSEKTTAERPATDGADFVAGEIELLFPSSSSGGRVCANITIIDDVTTLEGTEQFIINFISISPDVDDPLNISVSSFIGNNSEACVTIVDDDEEATNCFEAGYTTCCVYMMEGDCTVTTATSRCNCNQECYYFENCCEDVQCSLFQFEFESVEYTVSEGEGSVEVCVLVSPFLATSSRVTIQTSEKTTAERPATDGADFVAGEIELLFPSSSSGGRVCANITIIDDVTTLEGTEQFIIDFTSISPDVDDPLNINISSFIGNNSEACVTIVDDDEGEATNCFEAGYTTCCVFMMEGDCTVNATSRCFCNQDCYYFEDCCEDVESIGCSLFQFEFESVEYTVSEGEGSVEVCVLVSPFLDTPYRVTIGTSEKTTAEKPATDGVDFVAEEIELLFPSSSSGGRVCANISIIDDVIALEGTEQFFINFTYIIPDFDLPKTINSSFIGSNSEACVTIVDDDGEGIVQVNDSLIGDPLITVPILVSPQDLSIFNVSQLSLCYEVHGAAGSYFNLVTDQCTSVNGLYSSINESQALVITELGIRAVDESGTCKNIEVNVNGCEVFIDGMLLNASRYRSNGISVRRAANRVRISVPNCNDLTLVMWAVCTTAELRNPSTGDLISGEAVDFHIMRGLNFGHSDAHGLIGQFWNRPIRVVPFSGVMTDGSVAPDNTYEVRITSRRSNGTEQVLRSLTGLLEDLLWDGGEGPCLYAGNSQGGPIYEVENPNDPVIEGVYKDYRVEGLFEESRYVFAQFDETKCN